MREAHGRGEPEIFRAFNAALGARLGKASSGRGTGPVASKPGSIYTREVAFDRITIHPGQMNGVPCIRGLRIPVATVVGMMAEGMSEGDILAAYPDLEREDLRQALHYASEAVRERELPLRKAQ